VNKVNFNTIGIIGVDLETFDPNLKELGPGVFRKDAYVLGVSFATDNGYNEYLNVGHKDVTEKEKRENWLFIKKMLSLPCAKVFCRYSYDTDFLINLHGMEIAGDWHDISHAESLLDEYRDSYSLDSIAESYLGKHKEKGEIEAFCEQHNLKGDARKHLYLMPHALVEKYAKADTSLLLPILSAQLMKLEEESLTELYNMERFIFPLALEAHRNGMRVDETKRKLITDEHRRDLDKRRAKWNSKYPGVNVNSSPQLARVFDAEGIPFDVNNSGKKLLLEKLDIVVEQKRLPMVNAEDLFLKLGYSEKEKRAFKLENPSITSLVLETVAEEFPLAEEVETLKRLDKLINTFLDGYLVKYRVGEHIHPLYHLYTSDEGGCITGRMSSSAPNSQNFPAKKGSFNPRARDTIIPEDNCFLGKIDYSGQELRILSHFARGQGADLLRRAYNENPDLDFHQMTADMSGLDRKISKRLVFSISYGQGINSAAKKFFWTKEKAKEIYTQFNAMTPWLLRTRSDVGDVAAKRGYVRSAMNRRCRYNEEMRRTDKRYLMMNKLIQSTGATMLKKAIFDSMKAGLYESLIIHGFVHDEQFFSVPKTKEGVEAFKEMKHIMEQAIPLSVPVVAESSHGISWGETELTDFGKLAKQYGGE